jgi:hypothetical protein
MNPDDIAAMLARSQIRHIRMMQRNRGGRPPGHSGIQKRPKLPPEVRAVNMQRGILKRSIKRLEGRMKANEARLIELRQKLSELA